MRLTSPTLHRSFTAPDGTSRKSLCRRCGWPSIKSDFTIVSAARDPSSTLGAISASQQISQTSSRLHWVSNAYGVPPAHFTYPVQGPACYRCPHVSPLGANAPGLWNWQQLTESFTNARPPRTCATRDASAQHIGASAPTRVACARLPAFARGRKFGGNGAPLHMMKKLMYRQGADYKSCRAAHPRIRPPGWAQVRPPVSGGNVAAKGMDPHDHPSFKSMSSDKPREPFNGYWAVKPVKMNAVPFSIGVTSQDLISTLVQPLLRRCSNHVGGHAPPTWVRSHDSCVRQSFRCKIPIVEDHPNFARNISPVNFA